MMKSPRDFRAFFLGACLFSIFPILGTSIQACEDSSPISSIVVLDEHKVKLSPEYQRIQYCFRSHIRNHSQLIPGKNADTRTKFKNTLNSFVKGLRYWKGECILLRGDPMTDYGDIIETLLELPAHYKFLIELSESYKNKEFKCQLSRIENQWKSGKHFHYDPSQLNIYERQKAVLNKVEKDIRDMPDVFNNKLQLHGENEFWVVQTKAMLDLIITFLSTYENFITQLEQERLDFIILCQGLYPQTCTHISDHISMLNVLATNYDKAFVAINTSTTQFTSTLLSLEGNQSTSTSSLNLPDKSGSKSSFSLMKFGKKKSLPHAHKDVEYTAKSNTTSTSLPKIESKSAPINIPTSKKEVSQEDNLKEHETNTSDVAPLSSAINSTEERNKITSIQAIKEKNMSDIKEFFELLPQEDIFTVHILLEDAKSIKENSMHPIPLVKTNASDSDTLQESREQNSIKDASKEGSLNKQETKTNNTSTLSPDQNSSQENERSNAILAAKIKNITDIREFLEFLNTKDPFAVYLILSDANKKKKSSVFPTPLPKPNAHDSDRLPAPRGSKPTFLSSLSKMTTSDPEKIQAPKETKSTEETNALPAAPTKQIATAPVTIQAPKEKKTTEESSLLPKTTPHSSEELKAAKKPSKESSIHLPFFPKQNAHDSDRLKAPRTKKPTEESTVLTTSFSKMAPSDPEEIQAPKETNLTEESNVLQSALTKLIASESEKIQAPKEKQSAHQRFNVKPLKLDNLNSKTSPKISEQMSAPLSSPKSHSDSSHKSSPSSGGRSTNAQAHSPGKEATNASSVPNSASPRSITPRAKNLRNVNKEKEIDKK